MRPALRRSAFAVKTKAARDMAAAQSTCLTDTAKARREQIIVAAAAMPA